jgi:hypothetical protein
MKNGKNNKNKVAQKLDFFNFRNYIIMYNENKKIKKGG